MQIIALVFDHTSTMYRVLMKSGRIVEFPDVHVGGNERFFWARQQIWSLGES
jgi:hypothetical protein